jgi:DNA-binding NtrC family response regulator
MAPRDILIVDEDRQVREALHQIFIAAGYNTLLASDGREGLEVFRKSRPPLIVGHLKMQSMPDVSIRWLKKIREEDPNAAVIVMSGTPDRSRLIACLKLGAYACLSIPINMDELLITVERALERRQLLIERREHLQAHGQRQEAQHDVLIVEDNPAHRDIFQRIFLAASYNCLGASDGREGLEVFRKSRPPLVVTNLRMPVMNGIELLKQIRQEDLDAAVIVLGNETPWETANASLKLGAHAFLWKPINMDELLITAERALERRQLLIERRQREEGA